MVVLLPPYVAPQPTRQQVLFMLHYSCNFWEVVGDLFGGFAIHPFFFSPPPLHLPIRSWAHSSPPHFETFSYEVLTLSCLGARREVIWKWSASHRERIGTSSGTHRNVIGKSSESHREVIGKSLGSHREGKASGSHREVIGKSSGSRWEVIIREVIGKSSGNRGEVIGNSSGSHWEVIRKSSGRGLRRSKTLLNVKSRQIGHIARFYGCRWVPDEFPMDSR